METNQNLGLCNKCKAQGPRGVLRSATGRPGSARTAPRAARTSRSSVPTPPSGRPSATCGTTCPPRPRGLHPELRHSAASNHKPNIVFLDVTNRCNMNCPICIATIRGMGFDFNPPLEYFEKIFADLGADGPAAGRPTLRRRADGARRPAGHHRRWPASTACGRTSSPTACKLADEEYCKKLCEARVPMRFAFDGRSADIYEKMRHNRGAYEKKMKALENLKKYSRRKHAIIAAAAWGINDQYIGDLIQFVHENRDLIADLGIIPLTENWEPGTFDAAKTTTMEDVEKMVQAGAARRRGRVHPRRASSYAHEEAALVLPQEPAVRGAAAGGRPSELRVDDAPDLRRQDVPRHQPLPEEAVQPGGRGPGRPLARRSSRGSTAWTRRSSSSGCAGGSCASGRSCRGACGRSTS